MKISEIVFIFFICERVLCFELEPLKDEAVFQGGFVQSYETLFIKKPRFSFQENAAQTCARSFVMRYEFAS